MRTPLRNGIGDEAIRRVFGRSQMLVAGVVSEQEILQRVTAGYLRAAQEVNPGVGSIGFMSSEQGQIFAGYNPTTDMIVAFGIGPLVPEDWGYAYWKLMDERKRVEPGVVLGSRPHHSGGMVGLLGAAPGVAMLRLEIARGLAAGGCPAPGPNSLKVWQLYQGTYADGAFTVNGKAMTPYELGYWYGCENAGKPVEPEKEAGSSAKAQQALALLVQCEASLGAQPEQGMYGEAFKLWQQAAALLIDGPCADFYKMPSEPCSPEGRQGMEKLIALAQRARVMWPQADWVGMTD